MSLQNSVTSSTSARVESLRAKHKNLSTKIEQEQSHSFSDDQVVANLKREKLKLKEKIEGIRA